MVVPSSKWFPSALAERAAWMANFSNQFSSLYTHLGFVEADSLAVAADNDTLQQLATWTVAVEAYSKAATAFRREITQGENGAPDPSIPVPPELLDSALAGPGLYERLDNLVKRIRVAPNYSQEDGAMLGIVPSKTDPIAPNDMQPVLKTAVLPGNVVQVGFKRGQSSGIVVEVILDKGAAWASMGNFFTSPAVLNIPQSENDLPRAVQIRARYIEKGSPVGQWSETYNAVTTP